MILEKNLKLIEKVWLILAEIDNRLSFLNVQMPPEIFKVKNVIKNKEGNEFANIRENLYKGFRRLDEMGINDNIIDKLSSDLYLLLKFNDIFGK